MSGAVYNDDDYERYMSNIQRLGYREVTEIISCLFTGLDCKLFKNADGSKYILAFAGTDTQQSYPIPTPSGVFPLNPDVITDYMQLYGPWGQYYQAIDIAQLLVRELGANNIIFVGHSLGGGLAALSSMVTGRPAITYNPSAVMALPTLALKKIGRTCDDSNIYKYIMEGDYVTAGQEALGISAWGHRLDVHNSTPKDDAHSIYTMYNNLK